MTTDTIRDSQTDTKKNDAETVVDLQMSRAMVYRVLQPLSGFSEEEIAQHMDTINREVLATLTRLSKRIPVSCSMHIEDATDPHEFLFVNGGE